MQLAWLAALVVWWIGSWCRGRKRRRRPTRHAMNTWAPVFVLLSLVPPHPRRSRASQSAAPGHGGDRGAAQWSLIVAANQAVHPRLVTRQADASAPGSGTSSWRCGQGPQVVPDEQGLPQTAHHLTAGEYRELVERRGSPFGVPEDADAYLVRRGALQVEVMAAASRRRCVPRRSRHPRDRRRDPAPDRRSAGRDLSPTVRPEPAPVRLVPAGMTVRLRTWGPSVASVPWQITAPGGCLVPIEPPDRSTRADRSAVAACQTRRHVRRHSGRGSLRLDERATRPRPHRPPHPLGPGVVLAVPDVPAAARRPARRAAARSSRPTRPTPTSCSTGRWPWSTTTSPCAPRPRSGCAPSPPPAGWRWGPWYALPDEFLVSGETLVRNLQRGLRVASRFGGAMDVGYLPDMFGHVAQMPQLLRLFGFEHAVVWRGVPSAIDRSGFWWTAPDGSTVRAEYLPQGYGNGALVPDDAKALVRRIGEFEEEQGDLLTGPILWMNGTDHLMPQPWLGRVVAEANDLDARLRAPHLLAGRARARARPPTGLPTWDGRAALRRPRQPADGRGVEPRRREAGRRPRRADRSSGWPSRCRPCSCPPTTGRRALLDEAWLEVIRNSAHDSICACSVDEVCDAVLHRFAEATQIADGLTDRALHALGATVGVDGRTPVIVNPSARTRGGVVELRLPGAEVPAGLPARVRAPGRVDAGGRHRRRGGHRDGGRARVRAEHPVVHRRRRRRHRAASTSSAKPAGTLVTPPIRQRARRAARRARRRAGVGARHHHRRPSPCSPTSPTSPATAGRPGPARRRRPHPVTADEHRLANGIVTVEVDPADGTFAIDGHGGLGRLVDGGDVGDTYNWCPPDRRRRRRRARRRCPRASSRPGPVRGRLEVRRTYELPTHVDGRHARRLAARSRCAPRSSCTPATTSCACTSSSTTTACATTACASHLPLPERATRRRWPSAPSPPSSAGSSPRAAPPSRGCATYPSRRFVTAGGLTVAHEGLLEYELVDLDDGAATAGALAVTLLRCTGMLSQGPMATRPLPAGPAHADGGPAVAAPRRGALRRPPRRARSLRRGRRRLPAAAGHPRRRGRRARARRPARRSSITGAEVSAVVREAGPAHRAACSTRAPSADHRHDRRPRRAGCSTSGAARCSPSRARSSSAPGRSPPSTSAD